MLDVCLYSRFCGLKVRAELVRLVASDNAGFLQVTMRGMLHLPKTWEYKIGAEPVYTDSTEQRCAQLQMRLPNDISY